MICYRNKTIVFFIMLLSSNLAVFPAFAALTRSENMIPKPDKTIPQVVNVPQYNQNQLNFDRDIKILENQVELLTKELYQAGGDLKKRELTIVSLQTEFEKMKEEQTAFKILTALFAVLILLLAIFITGRKNKKYVDTTIERNVELLKKQVNKSFKTKKENIVAEIKQLMEAKESKPEANEVKLLPAPVTDMEQEIKKITMAQYADIIEQLRAYNQDFYKEISSSLTELRQEINEKSTSRSGNLMILDSGTEQHFLEELNNRVEEKITGMFRESQEKLLNLLESKEKLIIAGIQKTNVVNNFFNNGNFYLKNKSYEQAAEEFYNVIKVDPSFYGAYINLGKALEKTEKFDQAEEVYKRAIQVNPEYFKAYFNLGNLLSRRKNYDHAIDNYLAAIQLKPDYAKAYNNMGNTFQILERLEEAKEQYEKALSIDQNYADAYFNLSRVELILKKGSGDFDSIAESLLIKYNASRETFITVKQLIKTYLERMYQGVYFEDK